MEKKFYVYEHWRPDRGECFYVGKGHGNRANVMRKRNIHHTAIQRKLSSLGLCVEVKIIAIGLGESDAFALEAERIALWRSDGADLANFTNGGEGASGFFPNASVRKKMSDTRKGRKHSKAHREKLVNHLKSLNENEELQRLRKEAVRKALCRPETRKKLSESQIGKKRPIEMRMAMSAAWTPERRAALAERNRLRAYELRSSVEEDGDE